MIIDKAEFYEKFDNRKYRAEILSTSHFSEEKKKLIDDRIKKNRNVKLENKSLISLLVGKIETEVAGYTLDELIDILFVRYQINDKDLVRQNTYDKIFYHNDTIDLHEYTEEVNEDIEELSDRYDIEDLRESRDMKITYALSECIAIEITDNLFLENKFDQQVEYMMNDEHIMPIIKRLSGENTSTEILRFIVELYWYFRNFGGISSGIKRGFSKEENIDDLKLDEPSRYYEDHLKRFIIRLVGSANPMENPLKFVKNKFNKLRFDLFLFN